MTCLSLFFQKVSPIVLKYKLFTLLFLASIAISCNQFAGVTERPIARVETTFLYPSELTPLLGRYESPEDSTLQAKAAINSWVKKRLLYELALVNIEQEKQEALENLVAEYRADLFAQIYKETVVISKLDTMVNAAQAASYYENNPMLFQLKKPLYQYRLVVLPKDNVDLQIIRRALRRYNEKDQQMLDSLSFQFTDFQLNDSLWVDQNYFVDQMAFTSLKSLRKYQKKSQFFEIEDSLKVSLLFMKNFLDKGAQAPFSYVSQMITSIVLNKRKLDFLRQFDNEIIEDAIKNNKVEIYE